MTSDPELRREMGQMVEGLLQAGSAHSGAGVAAPEHAGDPGPGPEPGTEDLFLSRIGHELRTPLTTILGFGELLQMETLTEGQQQQVGRIVAAGRRLLELVNEVLEIARLEAAGTTVDLEPTDIDAVVSETVAIMGPLASERNVRIWVDSDGSRGVLADRQRLQRILLHLLSNAVHYNHQAGQVVVSATMERDEVRLSVTDTGPGIPADWVTRLFVPFDRLDAESTGVPGAGVGLSVSKKLVDAMRGTLTVESRPGQGSTFTVTLPVAELPGAVLPAAGTAGAPHLPMPPKEPAGTGRARLPVVLYAEDHLTNLSVMEEAARERGASLHVAVQGRMCVALARELRPTCIVLNPDLPDIRGETVLSMLRADPTTATIPVAVLRADGDGGGEQPPMPGAGVQATLTTPVDLPGVRAVLDRWTLVPAPSR